MFILKHTSCIRILSHKIDWDKALFLYYKKNWKRRKIKEAIYINAINPTNTMNKKDILNLEKGYELDAVWSEFNKVYRQGIAKKIGWKWRCFSSFRCWCFKFFSGYSFLLLSIKLGVSRGIRVMLFAISRCFFVVGLMMKPAWMLSQAGSLRKAPLSAETLDFQFHWQN